MLLQMRESVSVLELIPSLTSSGPAIAITMIHDRACLGDPWHKWPASDRTKGIEILDLDGPKRTKAQAPWDRRGFRSVIANKKFEYWKLITIWGLCRRGKPISTYEECFSGLEPRQLNEIASISIIFSLPCYCDIDIGGRFDTMIGTSQPEHSTDPSPLDPAWDGTMTQQRLPWLRPAYKLAVAVSVFHLFIAPYTKVEESFTLHATWDILTHGGNVSNVSSHIGCCASLTDSMIIGSFREL